MFLQKVSFMKFVADVYNTVHPRMWILEVKGEEKAANFPVS